MDLGLRSQLAWKTAHENGHYDAEITPVTIRGRRGDTVVSIDEHPQLSPLQCSPFPFSKALIL